MTRERKGTSQLALMAEDLPLPARICLALFAALIGLHHLQQSPEIRLARQALRDALNWHQGNAVDLSRWEDLLEAEESATMFASQRARKRSEQEFRAWQVLGNSIDYVAYRAFRAENRRPRTALVDLDDTILDHVDKYLQALDPSSMALIARATAYLKEHPNAKLAQVKAQVLRGIRDERYLS
jgi:hypothetical protein